MSGWTRSLRRAVLALAAAATVALTGGQLAQNTDYHLADYSWGAPAVEGEASTW